MSTPLLYLEDFTVGQKFHLRDTEVISADAIKQFASQYDPQPFHLDEVAAAQSFFGGLAASGWHTAALTMRLLVKALPIQGGIIGAGFEEFRWPRPTRPGDSLQLEVEVLELKLSQSRPQQGFLKHRATVLNQHQQPVLIMTGNLLVPRKPQASQPTG